MKPGKVSRFCEAVFETVSTPGSPCLCIMKGDGGRRIAGNKPWGGGTTLQTFRVPRSDARWICQYFAEELQTLDDIERVRKVIDARSHQLAAMAKEPTT